MAKRGNGGQAFATGGTLQWTAIQCSTHWVFHITLLPVAFLNHKSSGMGNGYCITTARQWNKNVRTRASCCKNWFMLTELFRTKKGTGFLDHSVYAC